MGGSLFRVAGFQDCKTWGLCSLRPLCIQILLPSSYSKFSTLLKKAPHNLGFIFPLFYVSIFAPSVEFPVALMNWDNKMQPVERCSSVLC